MPTAAAVPSVTDVSQERAESPAVVVDSDSAASTQDEVDREIHEISAAYARSREAAGRDIRDTSGETQPRLDYPPYRSSLLRHPTKDPHQADPETIELFKKFAGAGALPPL